MEQISAKLTPKLYRKDDSECYEMSVFPDSGASICVGGTEHLDTLSIPKSDLIPCRNTIEAVGDFKLNCRGWLPVEFSVEVYKTLQPLYICDDVDRIYFSKTAFKEFAILPLCFPNPMGKVVKSNPETVLAVDNKIIPCASPPSRPKELPYDPTPENIPKLKQYLIDQFSSSIFNRSAPFPGMSTPSAHIYLKPNAVPYARHTPIPIPHHWKEEVKQSLDEDVKRGIIKPVVIGTPVQWCFLMAVATKKDGRSRRRVDLQRLNAQSLRETHYCQSPFQLASQLPSYTYKTVIDAVDGYHAVPFDEESRQLKTFITEHWQYHLP